MCGPLPKMSLVKVFFSRTRLGDSFAKQFTLIFLYKRAKLKISPYRNDWAKFNSETTNGCEMAESNYFFSRNRIIEKMYVTESVGSLVCLILLSA